MRRLPIQTRTRVFPELPCVARRRAAAVSQIAVFQQLVRDHMRRPPVIIPTGTSCVEAVARMAAAAADSLLVVDSDRSVCGIVTEQDVTRRIAFQCSGNVSIDDVMTAPVRTIRQHDYLFHAIAHMRRASLRHMPVVDELGNVVGMLSLHEALAVASTQLMALIERLTHEETLDGLKEVKAAQVDVAAALFAEDVPALEVQTLLNNINLDIYRRVITLSLDGMRADGWGEPPVAFAAIVMGSGGRGESHLLSDQDNGFILADYPDDEHNRIDPYFIELAKRMTQALDAVGIPMCRGYVMALNPVWRKTLSQWLHQINIWMGKRSDVSIQLADIFFDFRSVFGEAHLAQALRDYVTEVIPHNPGFLREMYGVETDHRVALGWFGRLITERETDTRGDRINLKHRGALPLVEGVRLLALRAGIAETSTLKRIEALHANGIVDDNEQDYLTAAFRLITDLLLRQQVADYKAGHKVGNLVSTAALRKRQKDMLVSCLRAISVFRDRIRYELTGDIF